MPFCSRAIVRWQTAFEWKAGSPFPNNLLFRFSIFILQYIEKVKVLPG